MLPASSSQESQSSQSKQTLPVRMTCYAGVVPKWDLCTYSAREAQHFMYLRYLPLLLHQLPTCLAPMEQDMLPPDLHMRRGHKYGKVPTLPTLPTLPTYLPR